MKNQTLISLAILKTNSDNGLDVYDNFVPLVVECIRDNGQEIISVPTIKEKLINTFGICIPQHVIDTILIRLRNRGFIELMENKSSIQPSKKVFDDDSFQKNRFEARRNHEDILQELVSFCKTEFNVAWTINEAEDAFLSFLDEFQIAFLRNSIDGKVIPFEVSSSITGRFLIGSFVKHLLESHSSKIEYLDIITKGFMLANAMYLPNPSMVNRKFKKTRIFFDTTFLIHALGYAGSTRKAPCKELLELLYETGAELKCFRHTVEEIRAVLDDASDKIKSHTVGKASKIAIPNLEYFISIDATPSDIRQYISSLEGNLRNLRIIVEETPEYELESQIIDEKGFSDYLGEKIGYRNPDGNAKNRDVQSITSIVRLRRAQCYQYVEDSKAIFVTTNGKLARESTSYLRDNCHFTGIPACITDHMLTNILWLKAPLKTPDLPRKVIIADCFAATQPSHDLWKAYLKELDKQTKSEEITEDDYYLLRYELMSKNVLMEKTLGEEGAFTQGTVKEIMEEVKAHLTEGLNQELAKAKEELIARTNSDAKKREKISSTAYKTSRAICFGIRIIVFIILLTSTGFNIYSVISNKSGYVSLGISTILFVYAIFDYWKSIFIEIQLRSLEVRISTFIENRLLIYFGFDLKL